MTPSLVDEFDATAEDVNWVLTAMLKSFSGNSAKCSHTDENGEADERPRKR